MLHFRHRFRLARAPEDNAGGGGGGTAAAGDAGKTTGTTDGGGAAATVAADEPSLFDAAAGGEGGTTPEGKAARPDYIPEQFWDKEKGQPLIEQMGKSWSDLRTKVARGEGKIPDKPEGYTLPAIEGLPADLVKSDDPLWQAVRGEAHKAGLTESQLHAIAKPYLDALAKQKGAAPADAAAAKAARQAWEANELAKLGPNGKQLVADTGAWIAGMVARGVFTDAQARSLKRNADADGILALAKVREALSEFSIPTEAMAADSMTEADARKMLRDGHATKDQAKVEKATAALRDLERRGVLGKNRAA